MLSLIFYSFEFFDGGRKCSPLWLKDFNKLIAAPFTLPAAPTHIELSFTFSTPFRLRDSDFGFNSKPKKSYNPFTLHAAQATYFLLDTDEIFFYFFNKVLVPLI